MTTMNGKAYTKITLFFIIQSFLLVSCGNNRRPSSEEAVTNINFMEVSNIKEPELSIAKRVCYAYKSKRSTLKTSYHGKNFSFDIHKKDCQKVENSKNAVYKLHAPVDAQTLTWDTTLAEDPKNSFEFILNVQDEESGFLKQLCERIFRGAQVSNSLIIGSSETVQIQFSRSNIDQYRLNYFGLQNDEQVLLSSDVFKVRTQFDYTTGQILGFDEEIMRYKKCEKPGIYQEFNHKWKN